MTVDSTNPDRPDPPCDRQEQVGDDEIAKLAEYSGGLATASEAKADEKPPPTQVAAQKKATEFFDIGSPGGGAEEAESTEESVEAEPGAASAVEAEDPESMNIYQFYMFYVDELLTSNHAASSMDRQVFLTTGKECDEDALRVWLNDFGEIQNSGFLKDGSFEHAGHAYVTYTAHEHAVSLVDEVANGQSAISGVKCTWSLSEKMVQKAQGPFRRDTITSLANRLREIQQDLKCDKLLLGGDPWPSTSEEVVKLLGRKPYSQAWFILCQTTLPKDLLKKHLEAVLIQVTSEKGCESKLSLYSVVLQHFCCCRESRRQR